MLVESFGKHIECDGGFGLFKIRILECRFQHDDRLLAGLFAVRRRLEDFRRSEVREDAIKAEMRRLG